MCRRTFLVHRQRSMESLLEKQDVRSIYWREVTCLSLPSQSTIIRPRICFHQPPWKPRLSSPEQGITKSPYVKLSTMAHPFRQLSEKAFYSPVELYICLISDILPATTRHPFWAQMIPTEVRTNRPLLSRKRSLSCNKWFNNIIHSRKIFC
jgi:hypothetical protein